MYDGIDEDFDSIFVDGFVDMDPNSADFMISYQDWLSDDFSSPVKIEPSYDTKDLSPISSSDIPLHRKEWLVQDSVSRRHRSPRLFEFLILLLSKSHYASYASFADRSRGLFQIHQPEKVAELWEAVKSRQSNQPMTYDKFARAIRWYYKSNIMQKTNTKYTFQFTSQTLKNYLF